MIPNKDVLSKVPESFKKSVSSDDTKKIKNNTNILTKNSIPENDIDNNFKIEHFGEVNSALDRQRNQTQSQIRRENTRPELEKKKVETSFEKMYNNKGSKFRKKVK